MSTTRTADRTRTSRAARAGRLLARLAAVLAAAMTVAGLMAGGAAAERPEAQSANSEIFFCLSQGGEPNAWIREDGSILVFCQYEDYGVYCVYSEERPDGACIITDKLVSDPGTTGTGPRVIVGDPVPVPDEARG